LEILRFVTPIPVTLAPLSLRKVVAYISPVLLAGTRTSETGFFGTEAKGE
jgi:hypothetical protein